MQLTNKMQLPEPIVRAISNDNYTKAGADFSVTELLQPAQIARLRNEHVGELQEDASERIWSLLGSAVHSVIERAAVDNNDVLSETTLITTLNGKTIKGAFDSLTISRAELNDYKVTTVWKLIGGGCPIEWEQQVNIYRWMLHREKNIDVKQAAVIAILRDWSIREASRRPDYPQAQAMRIEVPLWDLATTEAFVAERLALHTAAEPQPCSDADIWAKPSKWAVMKKGRASAVKLFDSPGEAGEFASGLAGHSVEYRPGQATRCESYCPVADFCEQFKNDPRNRGTSSVTESLFST